MNAPGRTDKLYFAGDESTADAMLSLYDDETGRFKISMNDNFWVPVRAAHKAGLLGAGRTVAVLDSAPNLDRGPLREHVTMSQGGDFEPDAHGTVVDLFILTVAPDAQILHFDVTVVSDGKRTVSAKRVKEALLDPRIEKVDAVCLSFGNEPDGITETDLHCMARETEAIDALMGSIVGDPVGSAEEIAKSRNPPLRRALRCPFTHCLCKVIDIEMTTGAAIVAASGNAKTDAFCPALSKRTISTGFQTLVKHDTGTSILIERDRPSYEQADHVDISLLQVHPKERSSFAAPRLAGLFALIGRNHPAVDLLLPGRILREAWQLEYQMTNGLHTNTLHSIPTSEIKSMLRRIYNAAFETLPVLATDLRTADLETRLALQVFIAQNLISAGFHLQNVGDAKESARISQIAHDLLPWSYEPLGNLASACLLCAEQAEERFAPDDEILRLLDVAEEAAQSCLRIKNYDPVKKTADKIKNMRLEMMIRRSALGH